jgi:hypothetical protein
MADPSQILAARNAEVEQIQGYADLEILSKLVYLGRLGIWLKSW